MATHTLKIWPEYYEPLIRGLKTCELRRDDRGYALGDVLQLCEFLPEQERFSGRAARALVTHIIRVGSLPTPVKTALGLNPCLARVNDIVVLSLRMLDREAQVSVR